VFGIEISSSRELEKTLKLALGMKKLASREPTALGRKPFHPVSFFGGFFNPWDEEISIPDTRLIRKSLISNRCIGVLMPNLLKKSWIVSTNVTPLSEDNQICTQDLAELFFFAFQFVATFVLYCYLQKICLQKLFPYVQ
jgi:hypothetical protein